MKFTNNHNISLPIAVWLLHDDYDYINKPNYISATTLLAPLKQYILAKRIPPEEQVYDVYDFMAASLGTSIHAGIEKAWVEAGNVLMEKLGYPKAICDRIAVNPTEDYLKAHPDALPVWIEQRAFKEIDGWLIGGKKDMILDGRLFDNKSTSVWTYIFNSNEKAYTEQGSILRWLEPEKITDEFIYINFVFTDWQKAMTSRNDYPPQRTLEKSYPLMPEAQTEEFIRTKLAQITKYSNAKEEDMPPCSDEELWRSEPQYKYYADPNKTDGRSTKNFDNLAEANRFLAEKGKGVVITKPGEVKRCLYCKAFQICKQKDQYFVQP